MPRAHHLTLSARLLCISSLNAFVRVLGKVVEPTLVSPPSTGYLVGRSLGEALGQGTQKRIVASARSGKHSFDLRRPGSSFFFLILFVFVAALASQCAHTQTE